MAGMGALRGVMKAATQATTIGAGGAFPDGACTTLVLKADKKFINTNGQLFLLTDEVDFNKRFAPVYENGPENAAWTLYYVTHARDEGVITRIAETHRIPPEGALDIAKLLKSGDVALRQTGELFQTFASPSDRVEIAKQQLRLPNLPKNDIA